MRIEDALALVTARIPPIAETERVAIADADGRVLARPLVAPINLPIFDNSAVDGYAVAQADLARDGATILPVAGRISAGQTADGQGARGTAVRIFTGAPMPAGADTVFMQEDVRLLGDGRVELPSGLARGANRRAMGEDIARGEEALAEGRHLEPRDVALVAVILVGTGVMAGMWAGILLVTFAFAAPARLDGIVGAVAGRWSRPASVG